MSNDRSNVKLVGNTTQGQNVGTGEGNVFKDKVGGSNLRFRRIKEGANIKIIQEDNDIVISGESGGGDVNSVNAGIGLSGNTTTGNITLRLTDTGVNSGTYGSATQVPQFTVDDQGRITSTTNVPIDVNDGTVTQIDTNNGIIGGPITDSGTIGLTGQALALHNLSTNGLITRTGANTVAGRTISAGIGISVTNGDGVNGNPTINGYELYEPLTSGAAVTWNTTTGLNKTLTRGGNFTLAITNLENGMSGDLRLNVTSTTSITSITANGSTSNIRGNGSVVNLETGVYHLAFVFDGTNLDWNIAKYE